jgi:hypothetical protein
MIQASPRRGGRAVYLPMQGMPLVSPGQQGEPGQVRHPVVPNREVSTHLRPFWQQGVQVRLPCDASVVQLSGGGLGLHTPPAHLPPVQGVSSGFDLGRQPVGQVLVPVSHSLPVPGLQELVPSLQGGLQLPFWQVEKLDVSQWLPHVPQLLLSFLRSAQQALQVPLQSTRDDGQR